jgi:hypothetical protein
MRTHFASSIYALLIVSVVSLAACKHDEAASATGAEGGTTSGTAPGSLFGSGFEGDIAMHVTTPRGAEDVTFVTKGGKLRVDAPAHNGEVAHIVFDPQANKTLVILDAQKMYMEMDKPAVGQAAAHAAQPAPQIVKTGKHETIAGTDCEDWNTTEANGKKVALCVAQGIGFFDFASMGPGGAAPSAWADELRTQQYFPLRAVDTDAGGKETSRMEVTKIEKKSVDDSLFAAPAGYHTLSMPRMPQGIPGMPAGMPQGMPAGTRH